MAAPGGGSALTTGAVPPKLGAKTRRQPIRALAPELTDAIAAGEVIERPASVVKELVENSLDAGASRVTVELEGGGAGLIRVVDDGWGIPRDELALALERHATSKLGRLEDLAGVRTFGFRGEALASIAAVAQVVIVSRPVGEVAAWRVEVRPGRTAQPAPAGSAPGTTMEVRDLFGTVPARRAFLRSTRSEAAACLRVVAESALARPDVRFEARAEGRRQLLAPGGGDVREAAQAVLGKGVGSDLISVDARAGELAVVGLLGQPGRGLPSRQQQVFLVNGRRVHLGFMVAAVEGAFRGRLEVGRHPVAVLDVRCPSDLVDVNVHPAKREVRFRNEGQIFEAVQRACWQSLQGQSGSPRSDGGSRVSGPTALPQTGASPGPPGQGRLELAEGLPSAAADFPFATTGWRYLGQAHLRFLVAETDAGVALVDQHAAHERVLYSRILSSLDRPELASQPSQGLLQPLLLELPLAVVLNLEGHQELLLRGGLCLESFGERSLRCSAVPAGCRLSELQPLLLELAQDLAGDKDGTAARHHRLAASLACHSAIRFGERLNPEEAAALLRDLARTPGAVTCPHGRPTVLELSQGHLLTAFRRRS